MEQEHLTHTADALKTTVKSRDDELAVMRMSVESAKKGEEEAVKRGEVRLSKAGCQRTDT